MEKMKAQEKPAEKRERVVTYIFNPIGRANSFGVEPGYVVMGLRLASALDCMEARRLGRMHTLKTLPEFFDASKRGVKPFEVRKNDRDFQVGDVLELVEFDPSEKLAEGR